MPPYRFITHDAHTQGASKPPGGRYARSAEWVIAPSDPRWILAARCVLLADTSGRVPEHGRQRITESARRLGLAPIHAQTIIATAEAALARGGLDQAAAEQLMVLPEPRLQLSKRVELVFRLTIPLLAVAAVVIAAARWR